MSGAGCVSVRTRQKSRSINTLFTQADRVQINHFLVCYVLSTTHNPFLQNPVIFQDHSFEISCFLSTTILMNARFTLSYFRDIHMKAGEEKNLLWCDALHVSGKGASLSCWRRQQSGGASSDRLWFFPLWIGSSLFGFCFNLVSVSSNCALVKQLAAGVPEPELRFVYGCVPCCAHREWVLVGRERRGTLGKPSVTLV